MFNLRQWVTNATHDRGGLLDVVVTHMDANFIRDDVAIDLVGFSDHSMLSVIKFIQRSSICAGN